jgi:hypothetical protein
VIPDCDCGYDPNSSFYACSGGTVYGPCEYETCGGVCEPKGDCECPCHQEQRPEEQP